MLEQFEKMLAAGRDSALLRFGLGNEYLKRDDAATAATHFARAVEFDPAYSAAWKLLDKARDAAGDADGAADAWRRGIAVAQAKGDQQAAKEMTVFLRRVARR